METKEEKIARLEQQIAERETRRKESAVREATRKKEARKRERAKRIRALPPFSSERARFNRGNRG